MRSPKASRGGSSSPSSSSASSPGATERVPGSATGLTTSLTGSGAGGAASTFLLSKEPTCSLFLYFFNMLSLWYFQKGLEASLPLNLWRTVDDVREGGLVCPRFAWTYSSFHLSLSVVFNVTVLNCMLTWMLLLEGGEVVDVLVYNDVQARSGRNVSSGESLGHVCNCRRCCYSKEGVLIQQAGYE